MGSIEYLYIIYSLLLSSGILGLLFLGILNRHRQLERQLKEAIHALNVRRVSGGRR